ERLICRNTSGKKIDALYLPSSSKRTGNVLVFSILKPYQRLHPKKYNHLLEDGADIVLWNPTAVSSRQYSANLLSVLRKLREQNRSQNIAVTAYCAGVDPSIAAVSAMRDPRISLVIDRGFGDLQQISRTFTAFASLPCAQEAIRKDFQCGGVKKIAKI